MRRYDLTDFEWHVIEPLQAKKPRSVPRVVDRSVLDGFFWLLRSDAQWRDLPDRNDLRTACDDKLAEDFLALLQLASMRQWLRI